MSSIPIRLRLAVLAALFVSGFAALSYEVIWSRILGFVLQMGTSAHAFTLVLTVFLAGLGIGGFAKNHRRCWRCPSPC